MVRSATESDVGSLAISFFVFLFGDSGRIVIKDMIPTTDRITTCLSENFILLFYSCMSVSTFAALGFIKHFHFDEFALLMPCDNHLGDAFAVVDNEVGIRKKLINSTIISPR